MLYCWLKMSTIYIAPFISLHIRSMWETICDAWACWSGWNFGPNSSRIPLFWVSEYPPPPSKMKIVRESKSDSFRIPPPPNKNCQRVQIWEFQNTPPKWKLSESPNLTVSECPPPQWKLSESPNLRVSEYPTLPKMKIVRESKSESFRIPPLHMGKTSDFKLQNSLATREIVCGD